MGVPRYSLLAVVLALQGVALTFDPQKTGDPKITFQIGTITSNPAGSCIAKYNATDPDKGPGSTATCSVSAGAGKTVTITPSWVKAQPPPSG